MLCMRPVVGVTGLNVVVGCLLFNSGSRFWNRAVLGVV